MGFVQPESLQVIADSLGIPKLSADAAKALAPDVKFRLREIIQMITDEQTNPIVTIASTAPAPICCCVAPCSYFGFRTSAVRMCRVRFCRATPCATTCLLNA